VHVCTESCAFCNRNVVSYRYCISRRNIPVERDTMPLKESCSLLAERMTMLDEGCKRTFEVYLVG
jgi:hypothetical protein